LRIRSKGHKGRPSRQSVTAGLNLFPSVFQLISSSPRYGRIKAISSLVKRILPHVDVEAKPCIGQGWLIRSRLHLSSPFFSLAGEPALGVFARHLRPTLLDHLPLEAALDAYLRSKEKDRKQLCCRKWRPQLPESNGRPSILQVCLLLIPGLPSGPTYRPGETRGRGHLFRLLEGRPAPF
jgi:hypothetical protein